MSMLFPQPEQNERFLARREAARRRRRRRRAAVAALLLAATAAVAGGARFVMDGDEPPLAPPQASGPAARATPPVKAPRELPEEVRGIHVTMALASLEGKLEEYLELVDEGLNTIELDVKDENGEIGFVPSSIPLAKRVGAAKAYYRPREVARRVHERGVYLIGRIVVFEDPLLSAGAPELAVRTRDGERWLNHAGLGWTNPYDRRVWDYNVRIAQVAARAGFDEIQFDYVRFPTDGDVGDISYPGRTATPRGWVIAEFANYAATRLRPLGVRVSADVFGLAATRDLGIGQVPKRLAKYLDAIYPMVYPSHYGAGEYGLEDPDAVPGTTVEWALAHFRRELKQGRAELIPWIQDFAHGRAYDLSDVRAQVEAARLMGARGYLLWNPLGIYTPGALAPG